MLEHLWLPILEHIILKMPDPILRWFYRDAVRLREKFSITADGISVSISRPLSEIRIELTVQGLLPAELRHLQIRVTSGTYGVTNVESSKPLKLSYGKKYKQVIEKSLTPAELSRVNDEGIIGLAGNVLFRAAGRDLDVTFQLQTVPNIMPVTRS